jgi:hypothetical protein
MPSPPKTATEISYMQHQMERAIEAARQQMHYNQYTELYKYMSLSRTPALPEPAPPKPAEPPDPAAARFSKLQLD